MTWKFLSMPFSCHELNTIFVAKIREFFFTGSMPTSGHSTMNSSGELDRIIVDRPDTNTFIAHSTPTNGYNTVTLGRKTSTLSWAGGSPRSRSFRSLGRNGTMSLLHTPSSSKRHINDYGRSPTPHLNVRIFSLIAQQCMPWQCMKITR